MRIYRQIFRRVCIALSFLSCFIFAAGLEASQPLGLAGPRIEVVELRADFHADNTIVVVSGKIKNLNHQPLRGHVNIYLMDSSGHTIMAYEEPVNRTRSFAHGMTVAFESVINVADIKGIHNISVEFVRQ